MGLRYGQTRRTKRSRNLKLALHPLARNPFVKQLQHVSAMSVNAAFPRENFSRAAPRNKTPSLNGIPRIFVRILVRIHRLRSVLSLRRRARNSPPIQPVKRPLHCISSSLPGFPSGEWGSQPAFSAIAWLRFLPSLLFEPLSSLRSLL